MKVESILIRIRRTFPAFAIAVLIAMASAVQVAVGAIIWDGATTNYMQPGTDPTQPTNQDRLTPNVWLTRAEIQGVFNAKVESSYVHYTSPADTEWAFGELNNYASLTYTNWEELYGGSSGGGPTNLIGKDLVVHLISEDIYLSLDFTSWVMHGGTFSYIRSTPGVAPAIPVLTGPTVSSNGTFQFSFINTPGYTSTS